MERYTSLSQVIEKIGRRESQVYDACYTIAEVMMVAEDESEYDVRQVISELEGEMRDAATKLEFERAAHIRDQIAQLKKRIEGGDEDREDVEYSS